MTRPSVPVSGPRSRTARDSPANRVHLEAVRVAATRSDRPTMDIALRLLAVWAVKAARGQTRGTDADLTVSPPRVMNASGTDAEEKT